MYSPPWFLFNRHLETIYPALLRTVKVREYDRERIETPDRDFLDLDWLKQGSRIVVIISHGLEGNSKRAYVKGMAKTFYNGGFDVLAWNYRGCSEEMNKTLRFYHSGATDDLHTVIHHALHRGYETIVLVGFSLGGNLTLKYAGEREIDSKIKGIVTFSVPLDLYACSVQISKPSNWIYSNRFLKSLKKKIITKSKQMPGLDTTELDKIKSLQEFDDIYTGPMHGFSGAMDYYKRCSAIYFLESIQTPALIVNAMNDPFLSEECFPEKCDNNMVQTEFPEFGGHVGFSQFNGNGLYWSEQRALEFVKTIIE